MMNFLESNNLELKNAIWYDIGVNADIVGCILTEGFFEHTIGGPGLTSDVLRSPSDPAPTAAEGRLYFVYSNEPSKFISYLGKNPDFKHVPSPLRNLFVRPEYAIAVIVPSEYGLSSFKKEQIRIFSIDCVANYMEDNTELGTVAGTYVLKPVVIDTDNITLATKAIRLVKFSQIYAKAYTRMGLTVDHKCLKYIWSDICARNLAYEKVNDPLEFSKWVNELAKEPISLIR